jgi:chromosomal replication initiator protein
LQKLPPRNSETLSESLPLDSFKSSRLSSPHPKVNAYDPPSILLEIHRVTWYRCHNILLRILVFCESMNTTWTQCKGLLRAKVSDHVMTHWIEPIVCEDISETKIVLSVPSNFFVGWIRDRYLQVLEESLLDVTGRRYEIDFESRGERADENEPLITSEELGCGRSPGPEGSPETLLSDEFARSRNLNPRYTFESFVVGGCNQFAHAAAMSVAENLGGSYNPLFIYGGVGLGKTHLMSAIGFSVLSRDRTKRVSFTTSEEFTNEMINCIRYDKMVDFRNKYRNVDLLLIDDIQFIAGKERTQEEFFHTFNSIYENRKQIVLTSDRSPNEISELEHRLRSRFSWGLIADMGVPDLETRVAILRRKAFEDCIELPDEVAYFLAEHIRSNVRELVGYLVRVVAMSKLQSLPLTKQLAELALRDIIHWQSKPVTIDDIIAQVSKAFHVKPADLKSKKKHKLFSVPRQVGMFLARELTELSYPVIGEAFGGKDHSTVIYAVRKIEKSLEENHSLRNAVEALKKDLRQ